MDAARRRDAPIGGPIPRTAFAMLSPMSPGRKAAAARLRAMAAAVGVAVRASVCCARGMGRGGGLGATTRCSFVHSIVPARGGGAGRGAASSGLATRRAHRGSRLCVRVRARTFIVHPKHTAPRWPRCARGPRGARVEADSVSQTACFAGTAGSAAVLAAHRPSRAKLKPAKAPQLQVNLARCPLAGGEVRVEQRQGRRQGGSAKPAKPRQSPRRPRPGAQRRRAGGGRRLWVRRGRWFGGAAETNRPGRNALHIARACTRISAYPGLPAALVPPGSERPPPPRRFDV